MGLFDFIEDAVEGITETIVRLPEIPIRTIKGVTKGIEEGIEKIGESLE